MPIVIPQDARQLRRMLAITMGTAAVTIGVLAGGTAYLLGTYRADVSALERAVESARHFDSPAMQVAIASGVHADHEVLRTLLDRTRFVGIRVFKLDRSLMFERWADIPESLIEIAKARPHEWPEESGAHRQWIDAAEEKLIQVVLPLGGAEGRVIGYVEGISRLDQASLRDQRTQAWSGAWAAASSVLIAALLLYPLMLAMLRRANDLSRKLIDSNLSLLRSLGNAIAKRDSDTDAHNYRVTCYAVALAEALAMPDSEIADLVVGAFLHDVGKIGIPDRILLKPGKLDPDEIEIMKTHVKQGVDIVEDNPWLSGAAKTIRAHHERFDGSGYPDGLQGGAIPMAARVFAVADVFDALTSKRPYKAALPLNQALTIVKQNVGSHFDPEVVASFGSIAPALYAEIYCADTTTLKVKMQAMHRKYFR
jgi:HD-GYP domain-containing protein (c-di-GMP phosphodiesterase class II)